MWFDMIKKYEYPTWIPLNPQYVLGISWQTWQPRSMHGMAARWPQVFFANRNPLWCPDAPRHPHGGGGGVPCRGGVLERETLGLRHRHEMPWTYPLVN